MTSDLPPQCVMHLVRHPRAHPGYLQSTATLVVPHVVGQYIPACAPPVTGVRLELKRLAHIPSVSVHTRAGGYPADMTTSGKNTSTTSSTSAAKQADKANLPQVTDATRTTGGHKQDNREDLSGLGMDGQTEAKARQAVVAQRSPLDNRLRGDIGRVLGAPEQKRLAEEKEQGEDAQLRKMAENTRDNETMNDGETPRVPGYERTESSKLRP